MLTKVATSLVILFAVAVLGLVPAEVLAGSAKDSGSMEGEVVKRDIQPIPDQEGHVLVLSESNGTATNPGGDVDGSSFSIREALDLKQGSGSQRGYVIFSKGSDQRVVAIEGAVTTTMKNGQPNTTVKGEWTIVGGQGALAAKQGKGTYSGYFTSPDKFHVDWTGKIGSAKEANAN
jgi:hypothetical protein